MRDKRIKVKWIRESDSGSRSLRDATMGQKKCGQPLEDARGKEWILS